MWFSIDYIPILMSAFMAVVLGALWYSPLLFGNAWLRALGKSQEQLGSATSAMIASMVAALITAVAMEILVSAVGANTWAAGLLVGLIVGIGVVGMAMLSDAMFSGWGWTLYLIQSGYRVTYLALMGIICGAWKLTG